MPDYEYKCVAGPKIISVKNEEERLQAANAFSEIINKEATGGWEYVGIDEFETHEAQGCLGTGPAKVVSFKMLVFKRDKQN